METLGSGAELRRRREHPYIGRAVVSTAAQARAALEQLNRDRDNSRGPAVEVTYWFEVVHEGEPLSGLVTAGRMVLDHGTLKPWHSEGDASVRKPDGYDEFMSWATDMQLLGRQPGGRRRGGARDHRLPPALLRHARGRQGSPRRPVHGHGERAVLGVLLLPGRAHRGRAFPARAAGPFPRADAGRTPRVRAVPGLAGGRADHRHHRQAQDGADARAVLPVGGAGRAGRGALHQGRREHAPHAAGRAALRGPRGEGPGGSGIRPGTVAVAEGQAVPVRPAHHGRPRQDRASTPGPRWRPGPTRSCSRRTTAAASRSWPGSPGATTCPSTRTRPA